DSKALVLTLASELAEPPLALAPFSPELRPDGRMVIHYKPSAMPIAGILEAVRQAGLSIVDLSTEETDLEDIFLQLTSSKV
ncbi:MAG TPA: ABC transporter ATP-binding protein, partial [Candidatus Omnitrophota bacterium]|nr:ABC transporter ATP-binding protein [Candidatus Omnitrophota bacterium]